MHRAYDAAGQFRCDCSDLKRELKNDMPKNIKANQLQNKIKDQINKMFFSTIQDLDTKLENIYKAQTSQFSDSPKYHVSQVQRVLQESVTRNFELKWPRQQYIAKVTARKNKRRWYYYVDNIKIKPTQHANLETAAI